MIMKRTIGEVIFDTANVIFLIVLTIACTYPLLYVIFASLSDGNKLLAHTGMLFGPLGFNLAAYQKVLANPDIRTGYMNTIFIVTVGVTLNLIMTSFGAYVLSRKGVYFNAFLTKFIVFTMFFSGGLIPLYLTVKGVGLMDSIWALIIPGLVSTFNLIIMRTSFAAIPDSLEESARIDGANDFTILFKIILPLSKPVIAVMILYYGVGHWNSWFNAMIYIRTRSLFPLQLILREILITSSTDMAGSASADNVASISESIKYATIMVATIPILLIYPFLQKYFVKGVMIGAVKG
ncbi:MAG TPA: carbohydrate ABC transporter permease [Clostridiaceae bacterium]